MSDVGAAFALRGYGVTDFGVSVLASGGESGFVRLRGFAATARSHPGAEPSRRSSRGIKRERRRMAVREGFEPSVELLRSYNGLANRRLRPLGHLTATRTLSIREASSCGNPAVPKTVPEIVPNESGARLELRPSKPTD